MRVIQLRNSDEVVFVDDEDYEYLVQYRWYLYVSPWGNKYAHNDRNIRMHRLILNFPDSGIDHEDRNGLNNQKENLRLATKQQNGANQKLSVTNRSGFKGVYAKGSSWLAQIQHRGKRLHLGSYKTAKEAAIAYDQKAIELCGEFAGTNKKLGLLS